MFRMGMENGKEILITAHNNYKILPCKDMIGELEGLTGQSVVCRYDA